MYIYMDIYIYIYVYIYSAPLSVALWPIVEVGRYKESWDQSVSLVLLSAKVFQPPFCLIIRSFNHILRACYLCWKGPSTILIGVLLSAKIL